MPSDERTRNLLEAIESRPVNTDLSNVKNQIRSFDLPDETVIVQVVGSNGKGSVVHYLESLLTGLKLDVDSYTSPHFGHPRERFRDRGRTVTREQFRSLLETVDSRIEGEFTPFELLFFVTLERVERDAPDVLIVEAGMGGRWDATSAIEADITVFTGVEREHTRFLGNTCREIFKEQIAQIPERSVLLSVELPEELKDILNDRVRNKRLTLSTVPNQNSPDQTMRTLSGSAAELITGTSRNDYGTLINNVVSPVGRQEIVHGDGRRWLLDVAHTPGAMRALMQCSRLGSADVERTVVLFSCMEGKRASTMLEILSERIPSSQIILTEARTHRGMDASKLEGLRPDLNVNVVSGTDDELREIVMNNTSRNSLIIVTGSFSIVDRVRHQWLNLELL